MSKETRITINGRDKWLPHKKLNYDELVMLTFGPAGFDRNTYTVTYQGGHGPKVKGSLVEGESVKLKNKMIFNVISTTNA